jgi:starch synthase
MKTAIDNSDAVIIGGDDIPAELSKYLKKLEKPVLDYKTPEEFSTAYQDFYNTEVLSQ